MQAQSYNSLWKQVKQAQEKDLPQTVIKLADKIYEKGEQEQNVPQMLKATLCREAYQEQLTPDSFYTHLTRLEQWAQKEDDAVNRAVLYSLLGRRYVDYMGQNRSQLRARTELDEETPSADIREWSAGQFLRKADACWQQSLQDVDKLLSTQTDAYVPFVEQADGSRYYGHDMFHLLAKRAVEGYGSLMGYGQDSLVCARVGDIYNRMTETYRSLPGREDSWLLATLDAWQWKLDDGLEAFPAAEQAVRQAALQTEYVQWLDSIIGQYGTRPICVEAYIQKAKLLFEHAEKYAEALRVCEEGIARYASQKRVNELKNLRTTLLQPLLRVHTSAYAYPDDTLKLNVTYRNLEEFTLTLYRTTLEREPLGENIDLYDEAFYKKYATRLSSTTFRLGDWDQEKVYQMADTVLRLKVPAKPGLYVLRTETDVKGSKGDACLLPVTRFRTLTLPLSDGKMEVAVVDALSGHPVQGATLSFYDAGNNTPKLEMVIDGNATAVVDWDSKFRRYTVSKDDDTAMPVQHIYYYDDTRTSAEEQVVNHIDLLTDRSLYRPGQTVYVKGVSYEQQGARMDVLADKEYTIRLLDANRKELSVQTVRTNDFGSFTATFTLPSACLNGVFTLEVPGKTSAHIRVEEYKRPTFAITFHPVKEAYCLGDTVLLTGKVESFSGVPLQDVSLTYTVSSREMVWARFMASADPLASDTVQLDASGAFTLPVALRSDSDISTSFQVEATVTDGAGETQTASYILQASQLRYRFRMELGSNLCKEDSLSGTLSILNANMQLLDKKGMYRLYPIRSLGAEEVAGEPADEGTFASGERIDFRQWSRLPSGCYRLKLSASDCEAETDSMDLRLFSRHDTRLVGFSDVFCYEQCTEFNDEQPAVFYFGTSHKDAYVFVDVFGKNGRIDAQNLTLNDSIVRLEYPYKEAYGEGISVLFTFIKNNRVYSERVELLKSQPKRTLDMKWEVFRDRLTPGQQEEWKLVIKTPQGLPAAAEMLATLYDASLDQLYPNHQSMGILYRYYAPYAERDASSVYSQRLYSSFSRNWFDVPAYYFDQFYEPEARYRTVNEALSNVGYGRVLASRQAGQLAAPCMAADMALEESVVMTKEESTLTGSVEGGTEVTQQQLRTNFAETAFFYPQLRTNEQGEIVFSFTMPESLTQWNFQAWSHTKDMMTGKLAASVVTAKEFMLQPNMPRFVRMGDQTQVAANIVNQTQQPVKGKATLTLFEPATNKTILTRKQSFSLDAGKTAAVTFSFEVPDRYNLLGMRIVADGGTFSDGEQHIVPVLSNKEYITEAVAIHVRGNETRTVGLDSLFNRHAPTATDRRLTVEFTGNPAWYAIQALPSLSQQETDNAVSWATAWYANSLAGYIAHSQPRVKAVFDAWQATDASKETFLTQLEKNQEVKNILLSESPWLLDATTESEQLARLSVLFDVNQQNNRIFSALTRLKDLQEADGAWSWYKGMPGSRYMTTYITTLLVRLPLLTGEKLTDEAAAMKQKALAFLGKEAMKEYRDCLRAEQRGAKVTTLSGAAMDWLYLLALDGSQPAADVKPAYNYFLPKVKNELTTSSMSVKAQAAVILLKNGQAAASDFIASLKEHLIQEDEMGAHFAFNDTPYRWGMMPIPVHVSAMEALRLAGGNDSLLEEMKLWLLKQKQATQWDSPVATADAVYALLCQGVDLLANEGEVRISIGKETVETLTDGLAATAGLSYVKKTFTEGSALEAHRVTVEKRDEGMAWGAVYAQYLSPISDVKQHGGSLDVEKKLYVERLSADGKKTLQPLSEVDAVTVGDKIVSRITIRVDRAMDFVQLKDSRAACLEPMGSLSGYRWSNGIGYYVEIKDAATNFFFDGLGKGTYVLESGYRVARAGTYETGLATMQCAYAPEFVSHSAGGTLVVE